MESITLNEYLQRQVRILNTLVAGDITTSQVAISLGVTVRHVERLCASFKQSGPHVLVHGNHEKKPVNKTSEDELNSILELMHSTYAGFNFTHAREMLEGRDHISVCLTTLRRICAQAQISSPKHQRRHSIHRKRRDRMPQADGSPHAWLEDRGPRLTLVNGIDDATGRLWDDFWEGETVEAYMNLLWSVAQDVGLPWSIYTDRTAIVAGTTRRYKPLRNEETTDAVSQFSRACSELDIRVILANSPQAKGRTERSHATLQDRLVSELRLEHIDTMSQVSNYL
ncbi:MAG: ISNCY family transposase [Candidatus Dormibacteria bacterium]